MRTLLAGIVLITSACPSLAFSKTLILENDGQASTLYVDQTHTFSDVVDWIQDYYQASDDLALTLIVSNADVLVRKKGATRDYDESVARSEKKDIAYIINTLANDSLVSLAGSRSSLKKAGGRIDHLHPLKILMTIFKDEELKVGIRKMRERSSLVWDEFTSGIVNSFKEEASKQNMKDEFVQDFAARIPVDLSLIYPSFQAARWKDFINVLIDAVPRANDPNRYNM